MDVRQLDVHTTREGSLISRATSRENLLDIGVKEVSQLFTFGVAQAGDCLFWIGDVFNSADVEDRTTLKSGDLAANSLQAHKGT